MTHREHFGRMFEISFVGTSYKSERPIGLKNFKRTVALNTLVTNLIEKRKFSFRTNLKKTKVRIIHYLITRTMLPRKINNNYVIKDDITPLRLLIKNIPTNWMDGIFHYMSYSNE